MCVAFRCLGRRVRGLSRLQGLYAGGAPTDYGFINYLSEHLDDAHEVNAEDVPEMVTDGLRDFQQSGKRKFNSVSHPCQVRIGARSMKSNILPINRGILTISGYEIPWASMT
jgi:hypothetical protein